MPTNEDLAKNLEQLLRDLENEIFEEDLDGIPINEMDEVKNYVENINLKVDTAISLKEQEIEKLKEYKATLINSAVTGKFKVC